MLRLSLVLLLAAIVLFACKPDRDQTESTESKPGEKTTALYNQAKTLAQEVDSLWYEGEEVLAETPNEQVIALLNQLINQDPNYQRAAAPLLGKAFYRQKSYEKAVDWLARAAEADPGNVQMFNLLGFSYMSLGKIDSAKNNLARSIGLMDTEENRQYIVGNLVEIGQTAFEYGVEYESKAEFVTAKDYKNYGILVLRIAFDLNGDDARIARQIVAYSELVEDEETANRYREFLK